MKIVFATHNKNKVIELKALLPEHFEVVSLEDIGCLEDIPETADTIEGNARLKAIYVFENYGLECFADDSGLEVDALNGAPGVYSARYAGVAKSSEANLQKLLSEMADKDERSARFRCTIALKTKKDIRVFHGTVEGSIARKRRGNGGFGYDPVFIPEGYKHTFGELSADIKNKMSHRAIAVKQLVAHLKELPESRL